MAPCEFSSADTAETPTFLTGRIGDTARFERLGPRFRAAFDFLRQTDLAALRDGRVDIDGDNVFANVASVTLQPLDGPGKIEAHRAYADIHVPINGDETIALRALTAEELALPFDTARDCVLFPGTGDALTLHPGEFAIIFPPYGHRPTATRASTPQTGYRKICMKIRV